MFSRGTSFAIEDGVMMQLNVEQRPRESDSPKITSDSTWLVFILRTQAKWMRSLRAALSDDQTGQCLLTPQAVMW